jgi:hypothetical protein
MNVGDKDGAMPAFAASRLIARADLAQPGKEIERAILYWERTRRRGIAEFVKKVQQQLCGHSRQRLCLTDGPSPDEPARPYCSATLSIDSLGEAGHRRGGRGYARDGRGGARICKKRSWRDRSRICKRSEKKTRAGRGLESRASIAVVKPGDEYGACRLPKCALLYPGNRASEDRGNTGARCCGFTTPHEAL